MKYVLASDIHFHPWSAFSTINQNGINSRLQTISEQLKYAAYEASELDDILVLAGDLVHTRGSITTQVANVMTHTFEYIRDLGVTVYAIPGNHDLATRESTWASSILSSLVGVNCIHKPTYLDDLNLCMVPWIESKEELKQVLIEAAEEHPGCDVVMHTHLNGVIKGIPDTGFEASELSRLGFKRVFSGHLHNHVDFGNGAYSIGALTHQTWSDVDTKAGFLIVEPDAVNHYETSAPKFVDFDPSNQDAIVGNYARAKIKANSPADTRAFREHLIELGALDAIVTALPKDNQQRESASIEAGASLQTSISEWIKKKAYANPGLLESICGEILEEADAN